MLVLHASEVISNVLCVRVKQEIIVALLMNWL